jgi:hypothetical protein
MSQVLVKVTGLRVQSGHRQKINDRHPKEPNTSTNLAIMVTQIGDVMFEKGNTSHSRRRCGRDDGHEDAKITLNESRG